MKRAVKPAFVVGLGLVLYAVAANSGAGWLYVVAAGIGAVVIVSVPLPWWNARAIEVQRRAPTRATAGEPFECALEVTNKRLLARYLIEFEDRFAGGEGRTVAVKVGRNGPKTLRYSIQNPRRGVYAGGEVVVESGAPFGLFYGRRRTRVDSEIVVYPRTFDVAGLPPSATVDVERGDGSESPTLHRGPGGEFWGVREYRPGDPARLVAWKRSARGLSAGRLAVVELARETHPPFVVSLDLDPAAPSEAREMVVSVGASILLLALKENREILAHAGADNAPFPEEPTLDSLLTWCAGLLPSPAPDPKGASVEVRPSTRRTAGKTRRTPRPEATEAQAVVLVSCHERAGPGPWMTVEEETEFIEKAGVNGRLVTRLGAAVDEPWRIG